MRTTAISEYLRGLGELDRKLIEDYIDYDYVPRVRTGKGRRNNFLREHDSKRGVDIVREILKFKRMQLECGYLSISLNSKRGPRKNTGSKR